MAKDCKNYKGKNYKRFGTKVFRSNVKQSYFKHKAETETSLNSVIFNCLLPASLFFVIATGANIKRFLTEVIIFSIKTV